MSFFLTPGGSLNGPAKTQFETIKACVERGTQELLMRPDWVANMECVDLINSVTSSEVIAQVIFLLRRKLSGLATAPPPKQVYLTLSLVETLVKNCGTRLHAGVNNESFMKEMIKVARRYQGKREPDNLEVAELVLDITQAWGEAFLPRQRQFPNIVRAYQDLRREGLPFKAQYDASRVPIFTPSASSTAGGIDGASDPDTDAILAAAMAATIYDEDEEREGGRRGSTSRQSHGDPFSSSSSSSASGQENLSESLATTVAILIDMILAASTALEIAGNDIASDIASAVQGLQSGVPAEIERDLLRGVDTANLFKANDDAQAVLAAFKGILSGSMPIDQAKSIVQQLVPAPSSSSSSSAPATGGDTANLLDLPESPRSEAAFMSGTSSSSSSTAATAATATGAGVAKTNGIANSQGGDPYGFPASSSSNGGASRGSAVPILAPPSEAASSRPASLRRISPPPAPLATTVKAATSSSAAASSSSSSSTFDPFGPSTSSGIDALLSPSITTTSAIDELLSLSISHAPPPTVDHIPRQRPSLPPPIMGVSSPTLMSLQMPTGQMSGGDFGPPPQLQPFPPPPPQQQQQQQQEQQQQQQQQQQQAQSANPFDTFM